MHEQKRFVIAVAITAGLFSCNAAAQKDAAEKAKEGAIDHWIEYYKSGGQRKPAASAPVHSQPVPPPASQPAAGASPQGKVN